MFRNGARAELVGEAQWILARQQRLSERVQVGLQETLEFRVLAADPDDARQDEARRGVVVRQVDHRPDVGGHTAFRGTDDRELRCVRLVEFGGPARRDRAAGVAHHADAEIPLQSEGGGVACAADGVEGDASGERPSGEGGFGALVVGDDHRPARADERGDLQDLVRRVRRSGERARDRRLLQRIRRRTVERGRILRRLPRHQLRRARLRRPLRLEDGGHGRDRLAAGVGGPERDLPRVDVDRDHRQRREMGPPRRDQLAGRLVDVRRR